MTAGQIKKVLVAAGFDLAAVQEIDRDEVTIAVMDGETADYDATDAAKDAFLEILPWGGFRTGWGAWILSPGYQVDPYAGTKAGREHY